MRISDYNSDIIVETETKGVNMRKKLWKNITAILMVGAIIPFTVSCGRNEGGETVNTEETENVISEDDNSEPESPETDVTEAGHEGYTLIWEEQFDGDSLNREDWNVELHDPGWVNEELQAYVDSTDNIYIEDGDLVLKPIETVNEDGTKSYTSGRVNTQNKHDFKYGLFEARLKVPKGQGFLPAFWMMPTSENLYGQWPRCGEIDIMEVMGQATNTLYGTIHFGNPHSESQGTYVLEGSKFSDDYHVFSVEWEPGKM
ncbi:MAG: glycoside hydrolase family 16 protein, partial [Lachnospiraceae bacterium]|nr:glycoside hydrolase family 16 protein [Lachnospiraceae bacterium]